MKTRVAATVGLALVLFSIGALLSCKKSEAPQPAQQAGQPAQGQAAPAEERVEKNPDRNAYFGEEHIHTSWSVDAWLMGNRLTGPDDALKYAQGQTIKHPLGYDIKIDTPMDFMGVTDHSEYVGVTKEANTPGSALSKLPAAQPLILKDPNNQADIQKVFTYLVNMLAGPPVKALMSPEVAGSIWKENVKIADENNHPGKFTAFCSYEYTSAPDNRNLHRNIFFRDCEKVPPMPYSALDSWHPEDLWKWMDTQRKAGNELLAISHNANLSDGWMYPTDVDSFGRPIDAAWAASRDRNERLVEIKQIKGQSETHPLLSPNDEFANYELFSGLLGAPPTVGRVDHIQGSFGRQALKDGITMQDVRGYNPYKFGMAGGSDSHNTGSPYRQDNFYGGHAQIDGTVDRRMAGVMAFGTIDVRLENPGGLTGVWAEENTRASLWDAMYRKETFGTSGVHIKVRFFGGWGYNNDILKAERLGTPVLCERRPHGRRPASDEGHGSDVCGLGGERPDVRQSRPHPDHQGLDQGRPELREDLRRGLVRRPQARQVVGPGSRDQEHRGPGESHLHQRRRLDGIEDRVDRSRVRFQPACVLLRSRAGNPHAALDPHPGSQGRADPAGRGSAHRTGTRLDFAYLVHAERRCAQECARRHDGDRPEGKGCNPVGRCATEGADRGQGLLGAQQRDRRAVQRRLHGRR